jgi:type VI secretion system protein ImpL
MIAAAVVTFLFLALVWAAALLLPPVPVWVAIAFTVVALLAWAGALLWRRRRARAAAGQIEEALKAQAGGGDAVRPDQQAEIDAMRAEFEKAVGALKGSKLGRGGADSLAVLPWYMIIGPPGCGKSTALRASGLRFPYLSKRGGVRGVGGTRNCEWWLTNDAVLLDTAGRYTSEDEDRDEWLGFLDLLARTRPRKPVNGLLVAVSADDLATQTEEGASQLGHRLRERVDEVMARLKLVLPVYVVFTKCDLLPGFVETFADLRKQERGQIWGFTLPVKAEGDRTQLFEEGLDELQESLEERTLRRLGEERQLRARERMYELPQQLAALRPAIRAFVETLVAENVYQDTPILRGAYFTSGTQEGRTIDRVMGAMADAFGIRPTVQQGEPVLEAKSYFVRDVFAKVIFPDQGIAFRNAKAVKKDAIQRWALAGVAVAVALLFLFLPLRAYLANRDLMLRTGAVVDAVAQKLGAAGGEPPPLQALEPMRAQMSTLVGYAERGAPLSLGLGMYRGEVVLPELVKLYGTAVRRTVIDPVVQQDLAAMEAVVRRLEPGDVAPTAADQARLYAMVKLHLLLAPIRAAGEPRLGEAEQQYVAEQVAERWGGRAIAPGQTADPIAENAALYARLLAADERLGATRNQALVTRARRVLARARFAELALNKLIGEPALRDRDLALNAVLGGPSTVLVGRVKIRGAFTRRGYEDLMKARLDSPGEILEPWVLSGDVGEGAARLKGELEDLKSLYFERYIQEWRGFLDGVTLQMPGGLLPALEELTRGPVSPLSRLFQALAYNTQLGGLADKAQGAAGAYAEKALAAVGLGGKDKAALALTGAREKPRFGVREVEQAFSGLVEFGWAPPAPSAGGAPAPPQRTALDIYEEQLGFMREAMQRQQVGGDPTALAAKAVEASGKIQPLIDAREGWRPFLTALLMSPVGSARVQGERGRLLPVMQGWCGTVAPTFRKTIANRYPFARAGEDAALADVAEFFRPGGVLWGFYEKSLSPLVVRSSSGYQFAPGPSRPLRGDLLAFLKRAQDVSSALFPANATAPSVPFQVKIRPTPRVAAVFLDVDGQRFDYRNGPEEWHALVWPAGQPGATLRVRTADGREETLQRDGEWGFFRLLEAGVLKGEPGARDFTLTWSLPGLNLAVTADFRAARTETPFFAAGRGRGQRLLDPLRSGLAPPGDIASSGGGCP